MKPSSKAGSGPKTQPKRVKVHRSPQEKAAVMAALLQGQGVNQVSLEFDIPQQTISDWAKDLGGIDALRHGAIVNLVYDYLKENLTTLAVQSRHFRDVEWLKAQPASELATLHGVTADKAIRILSAMERAGPVLDPASTPAD